jgi:hypothetical protein
MKILTKMAILSVLLIVTPGIATEIEEIRGYTTALLDMNGFPGAYADDNVLTHGIANGQTVVNIQEGSSYFIGGTYIIHNNTLVIAHNTSAANPTQVEVNKIGENLWTIANKVREHFAPTPIDISVRVNPENLGPFGNNKAHFDRYLNDGDNVFVPGDDGTFISDELRDRIQKENLQRVVT